ncbi:pullulanase-associated domain-containing protein [Paenibacillus endoradicis]|uniref:pullulanase-associated domain-containing protein n=1 Tax=Paenibacillus endoradicis TaxID=2972487 RepID=UPI002159A85A|nr:pullulanase-associated domain-containing protein [Paenibacillus endoradicis]MCR8658623.1 alpha-amylase family glycosyl hydrolase [Paenibacillus endoradicis]
MRREWNKVIAQVVMCCMIITTLSGITGSTITYAEEISEIQVVANYIPENTLRIHYKNINNSYTDLGLWLWGDIATPSDAVASWPTGATPFVESQQTSYGAYVDIPLKEDAGKVYFLMVNRVTGDKEGHEMSVVLASPEINEIWVKEDSSEVYLWEPVVLPENTIRVHYERADQNYDDWGLWLWGDVVTTSEEVASWPTGASSFTSSRIDRNGSYVDITLKENAQSISFIVVNRADGTKDGAERSFAMLRDYNHIFIKEGNPGVFTSPYVSIVEESTANYPDWSKDSTIYEVNIRQYTPEGSFKAFEAHLPRLKKLGVEILWLMPIHPISEEKRVGTLGSYYAPADYKAVNPEFGTMDDFKNLVDTAHDLGFKVVLDWVANHTGWDSEWINNEGWYNKDEEGNIVSPNGWADVADLNYDNADMRLAMIDAMKYWVLEADIDGYRADFAAGVPKDFWETARTELDAIKPVYMLAEDDSQYQLMNKAFNSNYGWDLFYNVMLGIPTGEKEAKDIKSYIDRTKMLYPTGSYPMHFITNHDINSWEGTTSEMLGQSELALATLTYTLPGMPLIYSGQEAGLDKNLMFFEKDEIDWSNQSMKEFYTTLTHMKKENEALWNGSFGGDITFINSSDPRVLAFEREKNGNKVITVLNLTDQPVETNVSLEQSVGRYYSYFENKVLNLKAQQSFNLAPWEYYIFSNNIPSKEEVENPKGNHNEEAIQATDLYVVQEQDLRNLTNDFSIVVPSNFNQISLPINSVDLIKSTSLQIQFKGVSIAIPSTVLQNAKSNGVVGDTIVLKAKEESVDKVNQLLNYNNKNGTTITLASGLYQLSLVIMSGEQITKVIDTFVDPITLTFEVKGNLNKALTGIYYSDAIGNLQYVGTTFVDSKIYAKVNHFSHYSVLEFDKKFEDISLNHNMLLPIKSLAAKQIINGVTPTLFAPNKNITRAEFATMLVRALNIETANTESTFKDVSNEAWYAQYVNAAYDKGIITGITEHIFEPNKMITAQEMAVMLLRAYQVLYPDKDITPIDNESSVIYINTSPWAITEVSWANELNLLGNPSEPLDAQSYVARAETAHLIYNLLMIQ